MEKETRRPGEAERGTRIGERRGQARELLTSSIKGLEKMDWEETRR